MWNIYLVSYFTIKAQRREDTKIFSKRKLLINGKCFQPFEHIERIEPFEHFLETRMRVNAIF